MVTTQAYMTLTTVAAWVFLALVAIGIAYGIYTAIMEEVDRRREEREAEQEDPYAFETLEEAVEAWRDVRDRYNDLRSEFRELQDRYQDLSMKCRRHAVGIERENVERKSE